MAERPNSADMAAGNDGRASQPDRNAEGTAALIRVEVVYALPERQTLLSLQLPAPATVADVLLQAAPALQRRHPALDWQQHKLGIFSRLVTPSEPVQDGDRIEIYRPLHSDPMQQRRQRAAQVARDRKGARLHKP